MYSLSQKICNEGAECLPLSEMHAFQKQKVLQRWRNTIIIIFCFAHRVRDNHHLFPTASCISAHFPQSVLSSKTMKSVLQTSKQNFHFSRLFLHFHLNVPLFYKGNVNSSTRKVRSQGPLSLHQTVGSGPPPSLQTPYSQLHSLNKLRSIHPTNWCCCYPCEWNTILGNTIISLNPTELVRPHNPKGQGFLTMAASSWPLCMRTALTSSVLRLQKAGSITVVSLRPKAIWESQQTKQNLHNCIRDQRFCRLTN